MQSQLEHDVAILAVPRFPGGTANRPSDETLRWVRHCTHMMTHDGTLEVHRRTFSRAIGSDTPCFVNLIGLPRTSPLRVLLLAHADTLKDYPGAVDAATCMAAAVTIATTIGHSVGVALVDGEEAYNGATWSPATAMSGSQDLVTWLNRRRLTPELVVVLDLWGGPPSSVFTIHHGCSDASRREYMALAETERRLYGGSSSLFTTQPRAMTTQNDSWPFLRRPSQYPRVLDLIATPFPPQWHVIEKDTVHNANLEVLGRTTMVLLTYLRQYLGDEK
jgi:hypothetical protein